MMNKTGERIIKNAGILFSTQMATWVITFVTIAFTSRYLGPEGIGKINLAFSLWAIITVISTFGTDNLVLKEISRSPDMAEELISATILIRMLLLLIGSIFIFTYSNVVGYSSDTILVIMLIGFITLLLLCINMLETAFRGLERMEFMSISVIISKLLNSFGTIAVLLLGFGIYSVISVSIVAALIQIALLLYFFIKIRGFRFRFNKSRLIWILKMGFPFLAVSLLITLYLQVDVVILSLLISEKSVGWYTAANQITGSLLFIPSVFMGSVFPALSRLFVGSFDTMQKLFQKSFNLLFILGMPIGLGIMLVAQTIVVLVYGNDFVNSGLILSVRGVVLILTYQTSMLGLYFITSDRQVVWTWVMLIATIATICLDLVLIPLCERLLGNGAVGGSISYLVTESGMLLYGIIRLRKEVFDRETLLRGLRIVLAGVGMTAITWYVRDYFILVPVVVGAVSYIGLILLLKVITPEDRVIAKYFISKFVERLPGRKVHPAEVR